MNYVTKPRITLSTDYTIGLLWESPIFPPMALSKLEYKYFMNNNPNVPDGWGMPDDLAKKVSEALNRKSITPEGELQDALEEMARDIALIEPDPQDWAGWVSYLLEKMEEEAQKDRKSSKFETMLQTLRDDLEIRIQGGKW